MITFELLCARFGALCPDDLRRWIAEGHVHAAPAPGGLQFTPIDVARVQLILELRDNLAVDEAALPVVLSLLDQLYALRRRLRGLGLSNDAV